MNDDSYLAHYGVVGMRWGVRHDRPKAYRKATKKAEKLTRKAEKREGMASAAREKARKSRYGITSTGRAIWENRQTKAGRLTRKADKATRKAEDWLKAMHETFGEIKLDDIK